MIRRTFRKMAKYVFKFESQTGHIVDEVLDLKAETKLRNTHTRTNGAYYLKRIPTRISKRPLNVFRTSLKEISRNNAGRL